MQTIVLTGKKELDIYINPQRQRLLRQLAVEGAPMTPKRLSVLLGISPSAVQHHLQKLLELGVVRLDHTELVRGITAHYYRALPVTVRIGCDSGDELQPQRLALMQNALGEVFEGFAEALREAVGRPDGQPAQRDPSLSGGEARSGQPGVSPSSGAPVAAGSAVEPASAEPGDGILPVGLPLTSASSGLADKAASAEPGGLPAWPKPGDEPVPPGLSDAAVPVDWPGDVLWGITHVDRETARGLLETIRAFLAAHEQPQPGSEPWEYALIAYRATEGRHA